MSASILNSQYYLPNILESAGEAALLLSVMADDDMEVISFLPFTMPSFAFHALPPAISHVR
jgi:hypothetical protein